jgi:CHAD domain-containing protein
MDTQFSTANNRTMQLQELEQEIQELEQKMQSEITATVLHDLRLRVRFLRWKKELLSVAFGKGK